MHKICKVKYLFYKVCNLYHISLCDTLKLLCQLKCILQDCALNVLEFRLCLPRKYGENSEDVSYGQGTPTLLIIKTYSTTPQPYFQDVESIIKESGERYRESRETLLAFILNLLSSSIIEHLDYVCVLGSVYSLMKLFFPIFS